MLLSFPPHRINGRAQRETPPSDSPTANLSKSAIAVYRDCRPPKPQRDGLSNREPDSSGPILPHDLCDPRKKSTPKARSPYSSTRPIWPDHQPAESCHTTYATRAENRRPKSRSPYSGLSTAQQSRCARPFRCDCRPYKSECDELSKPPVDSFCVSIHAL